ncbi:MAG TPA: DinB family protein [Casimicrobiaceae bacterium]|nr:DinB family protein [Casimicrobiaceae bacterium]
MASLAHHLYTMACNNAWANHRLLACCSQLTQDDFAARRTSFFPSIKATLNHNLTVDWYYLDALERGYKNESPNREWHAFFDPEEPFDSISVLSIEQHATDRRLITLCGGLTDADVDRPIPIVRKDGVHVESATRLLAHLFQHQIHHRGQAHAMLAGTRVKPPQLDEFFCANEASLRADELSEIGLSETGIWEPK